MLLEVNNLSVAFGGVQALNLDHFHLEDKELRVVIGPNGAGKVYFHGHSLRQNQTRYRRNII